MGTVTENKMPVILTPNAVEEIKTLLRSSSLGTGYGLRLGVKGGGCAGFSYILDFDLPQPNDSVFELDDFNVYIDKAQEIYLYGTEIDFKNGLDNRGFIYNNPNATGTCGCGTSFSA
jgi:iron-sulfur cluster assembly protein